MLGNGSVCRAKMSDDVGRCRRGTGTVIALLTEGRGPLPTLPLPIYSEAVIIFLVQLI